MKPYDGMKSICGNYTITSVTLRPDASDYAYALNISPTPNHPDRMKFGFRYTTEGKHVAFPAEMPQFDFSEPKVDLTKPVQCRNGTPARVICTDAKNTLYPVVALLIDASGNEEAYGFTTEGKFLHTSTLNHPRDLVNLPAFDPAKPVQTKDGRAARILCTDLKHPEDPMVVAITHGDGHESVYNYQADGRYFENPSDMDLENV